jgi:signal transduction histidine kinase
VAGEDGGVHGADESGGSGEDGASGGASGSGGVARVGGASAAAPVIPQPGRLRRFAERHPRGMDWTAAACFVALSASSEIAGGFPGAGPVTVMAGPVTTPAEHSAGSVLVPLIAVGQPWAVWLFFVGFWLGGSALLVLWRRRHPIWVLAGAIALDAAVVIVCGRSDGWLVLFALFAVAQRASARAAWIGLAVTCAEVAAVSWVYRTSVPGWSVLIPTTAMYVLVVSIFIHFGNRRRYVAALVDRAHHLARERDQRAQIAVAHERARIAREMHDVIAHSVAVMVTLADGAQAAIDRDPQRASQAMAMVSQTGRHTVADMRRLLSVLRSEAELVPQPGAADLLPLVESFTRSGMPVTLELAAAIPEDQALALTVYRIVQESLTNVLRHAGGPQWTRVRIDGPAADTYRVEVENGPPGDGAGQPAPAWQGSGQGLVGMGQRVEVFAGQLEAGPTAGGGWRVVATLKEER